MNHWTKQSLQLWMLNCPVTKHFWLVLCRVKCCFVSKRVTRANINFFVCFMVNKFSIVGAVIILEFLHLFIRTFPKSLAFFCTYSRQGVEKPTVMQTSTVPHNSVQASCTPKYLICGFVQLWRTKWVSLSFTIKKTPNLLTMKISASSISTKMHDICFNNRQCWK